MTTVINATTASEINSTTSTVAHTGHPPSTHTHARTHAHTHTHTPCVRCSWLAHRPIGRFHTYVHTNMHTYIYAYTSLTALFSGTTRVSRYQKGKTNLDFTGARDSEWQWHQLGHMQVCISLQTDNHASTPPLSFYRQDALPAPNQQRQSTEG